MAPRIVDKEAKRAEILRAALPVLAGQGVHSFKMIDVAIEAGVGKGTLYEYFDSKEALIKAAFTQLMADYVEFVSVEVEQQSDPLKQIQKLLELSCRFFAAEEARLELLLDLWASGSRKSSAHSFLDGIDPLYRESRIWLSGIIKQGIKQGRFRKVDPLLAASLVLAIIDGLLFQSALGLIDLNDAKTMKTLNQTILEGITK